MKGLARCGDLVIGICCCHDDCIITSGFITTCSLDIMINSRGAGRCGDIAISACGHVGVLVTCSQFVISNDRGQAKCGDLTVGCFSGTVITCSNDSLTE